MIKIITGNPAKYANLTEILDKYGISVTQSLKKIIEIQSCDPDEVIRRKALDMFNAMGRHCLVDDTTLSLSAFPGFPGTYTSDALRLLGYRGFESLVEKWGAEASLTCRIGMAIDGMVHIWRGSVSGMLRPTQTTERECSGSGLLSIWFVPDEGEMPTFLHRRRAIEAVGEDLWKFLK